MQMNLFFVIYLPPPYKKGYIIVEMAINSLTDEIYKKIAARILERKNNFRPGFTITDFKVYST